MSRRILEGAQAFQIHCKGGVFVRKGTIVLWRKIGEGSKPIARARRDSWSSQLVLDKLMRLWPLEAYEWTQCRGSYTKAWEQLVSAVRKRLGGTGHNYNPEKSL